jgi:hypothetical protein
MKSGDFREIGLVQKNTYVHRKPGPTLVMTGGSQPSGKKKKKEKEKTGRVVLVLLLGRRRVLLTARGGAGAGWLAGWDECGPVRSAAGFPLYFLKTIFPFFSYFAFRPLK